MKKLTKLMAIAVGMLMLPFTVNAEAQFTFDCDKSKLEPGGTTQCVIKATDHTDEGISSVTVQVMKDSLKYITVNGFVENSTQWSITTKAPESYLYSLKPVVDSAGIQASEVGAYNITLDKDAAGDCGTICVKVDYIDNQGNERTALSGERPEGTTTGDQDYSCEDITIDKAVTPPNSGAFADYAVLIGVGALAVGAILLASKKSKFYRV